MRDSICGPDWHWLLPIFGLFLFRMADYTYSHSNSLLKRGAEIVDSNLNVLCAVLLVTIERITHMPIMKQLSIFLENKPGVLGTFCEELAANEINILGLSVSDTVDHAVVRVLCDNSKKACTVLGDAGMLVVETDVLVVDLPDKPGILAQVAKKLAKAKINIEYAYGTAEASGGKLVLRVSDAKKALTLLKVK